MPMYVNAKMILQESMEGVMKENVRGGEFMYDIFDIW
jgi:hypothetical protein